MRASENTAILMHGVAAPLGQRRFFNPESSAFNTSAAQCVGEHLQYASQNSARRADRTARK